MKKDLLELNPHNLVGYDFNWEKAYKYAKLMENGVSFPPIRVSKEKDGSFHIRNGMHRSIAAKLTGNIIIAEIENYYEDDFFDELEENFKIR